MVTFLMLEALLVHGVGRELRRTLSDADGLGIVLHLGDRFNFRNLIEVRGYGVNSRGEAVDARARNPLIGGLLGLPDFSRIIPIDSAFTNSDSRRRVGLAISTGDRLRMRFLDHSNDLA